MSKRRLKCYNFCDQDYESVIRAIIRDFWYSIYYVNRAYLDTIIVDLSLLKPILLARAVCIPTFVVSRRSYVDKFGFKSVKMHWKKFPVGFVYIKETYLFVFS